MTEATYTEVVWWQPESWDIYISEKGNDTEITRFIYIVMAAPFPLCFWKKTNYFTQPREKPLTAVRAKFLDGLGDFLPREN